LGDGWLLPPHLPGARGSPKNSRSFRVVEPKYLFQFCIERSQSVRRLFLQLRHCGSSAGVAHGRPRARVPDLVGSRLPSPYHFRARIQSFQAVAAPFRGDSALSQSPLAPHNFCAIESISSKDLAAAGGARHREQSEATQTRGCPTAAWSGYLFAMSQIATACPLRAYRTWPGLGCTKAKAPGGVGHAGSCHEF
jgi:hypothetical protein